MRTTSLVLILSLPFVSLTVWAQSNQYKRPGKKVEASAPATDAKATKSEDKSPAQGDKLDTTDLEQKYWAPKDTDFSVVQNRTYTKAGRFSLSPMWGPLINDAYSDGSALTLAGNYFFSERMGLELTYLKASPKNNKVTQGFLTDPRNPGAVVPDHGKVLGYTGVSYNFVPIYAKVSFLNESIIYFDFAISPGVAQVTYEKQLEKGNSQGKAMAVTLDLTQYYFLNRRFALRFDIRNAFFKEDVYSYKDADLKLRTIQNTTTHFLLGATYYF